MNTAGAYIVNINLQRVFDNGMNAKCRYVMYIALALFENNGAASGRVSSFGSGGHKDDDDTDNPRKHVGKFLVSTT